MNQVLASFLDSLLLVIAAIDQLMATIVRLVGGLRFAMSDAAVASVADAQSVLFHHAHNHFVMANLN